MFSPNVVNAVGYLSLGVLAFFTLMTFHQTRLWLKERRAEKKYVAGESAREETVDRFMARNTPSVAKRGKHTGAIPAQTTGVRTVKPKTAPVKVAARPKTSAVAVAAPKTSARAQVSKKWDPWSNEL